MYILFVICVLLFYKKCEIKFLKIWFIYISYLSDKIIDERKI